MLQHYHAAISWQSVNSSLVFIRDFNITRKLYPTGFNAGRFYGTAKVDEIDRNDKVDILPLRPITFNIGKASNQLAKYFGKLLSPLSKREATMQSSTEFMKHMKTKTVPCRYQLISLDVISLFTNVPLDATIDIGWQIHLKNRKINTTINKREMKSLIKLCTKDNHFHFNGTRYVEKDGDGFSVSTSISRYLHVEIEWAIIPKLSQHLQFWKRYVDDTICFVRNWYQEFVLPCLNGFHNFIQFTYEIKKQNEKSFLNILIIRSGQKIETHLLRCIHIQTYTFIGIHLQHLHGNVAQWKR